MNSGTLSFQSNDRMDVFFVTRVAEDGISGSYESLIQVEDSLFESDKAWVTGNVPKIKKVDVDGDTAIINAWFKGEDYDHPFVITIYLECETAEELEAVIEDDSANEEKKGDPFEPMEINL